MTPMNIPQKFWFLKAKDKQDFQQCQLALSGSSNRCFYLKYWSSQWKS
jgi:hypothetical protein